MDARKTDFTRKRRDSLFLTLQVAIVAIFISFNAFLIFSTESEIPSGVSASIVHSELRRLDKNLMDLNVAEAVSLNEVAQVESVVLTNTYSTHDTVVIDERRGFLNKLKGVTRGLKTKVGKVSYSIKSFFRRRFSKRTRTGKTTAKNSTSPAQSATVAQVSQTESSMETSISIPLDNSSNDTSCNHIVDHTNDHVEMDITKLSLSEQHVSLLYKAHQSVLAKNENNKLWAEETKMVLSPHLAYRYYISVDWSDTYNENSVDKAIIETIEWRREFGIGRIDTDEIAHLVKQGVAYTSPAPDKHGRAIIYLKIGAFPENFSEREFLNVIMYTVERADRLSLQYGSGEFVTLLDFEGFTWRKCPPISQIKLAIVLLRKHYPYRLAGIFILNTGSAFQFLWQIVKPLMPKKALQKTIMMSKSEAPLLLEELVGLESLEVAYGGAQKPIDANSVEKYFASGFWATTNR